MFILITWSLFAAFARASTLVECTNDLGHKIMIRYEGASPDDDARPGEWRMILNTERYPTDPGRVRPPNDVRARSAGPHATLITITHAEMPTGPVGKRVLFSNLDGPTPTAVESIFGGFVGRATLPTYTCTKQDGYCGDLLAE